MASAGSILGNPVLRREDPGHPHRRDASTSTICRSTGCCTSRSSARRSPTPRSRRSTPSDAEAMPGVVAVYTADDLDLPDHHGFMMLPPTMNRPPLARDKVRFVGDIVAMVVAETKAQAVDAAESGDRRLRPAARGRRHRSRARAATRRSCTRRRARTSPTRWAPVRSKACSTTPTSSCTQRIVNQRRRAGADGAGRHRRGARASRPAASRSGSRRRVRTACATSSRRMLGLDPDARARRATPRSAAASAPRQGMIVEYLLVAQGRARCSTGR